MRFLGAPAAIALVRIADSNLFFLTNLRDNALVHAEAWRAMAKLLVAMMSREIRTLMKAVLGLATTLPETNLNREQLRSVLAIHNAGDNLLQPSHAVSVSSAAMPMPWRGARHGSVGPARLHRGNAAARAHPSEQVTPAAPPPGFVQQIFVLPYNGLTPYFYGSRFSQSTNHELRHWATHRRCVPCLLLKPPTRRKSGVSELHSSTAGLRP